MSPSRGLDHPPGHTSMRRPGLPALVPCQLSSVQPRRLFSERAVCRELGRGAGSRSCGWVRATGGEVTCVILSSSPVWSSFHSLPPCSSGRAIFPISFSVAGPCLPPLDSLGQVSFPCTLPGYGLSPAGPGVGTEALGPPISLSSPHHAMD